MLDRQGFAGYFSFTFFNLLAFHFTSNGDPGVTQIFRSQGHV